MVSDSHTRKRGRMKQIISLILIAALLLIAGCTTPQTTGEMKNIAPTPGSIQGHPFKFNDPVTLTNKSSSFIALIENIETTKKGPDNYLIDIYITIKNTGSTPLQLVWFSRITDNRGKTYGGVGVSHGGSGAVASQIPPGYSATARDFVRIESDSDFAALADGAILDVTFIDQIPKNQQSAVFHDIWTIGPGIIK